MKDRKPEQPQVEELMISNVWFHKMYFEKAGDFKIGHKHNFDHAHLVAHGSLEAFAMKYKDDTYTGERISLGVYNTGDIFLVPSTESHTIVALEDNTLGICIQAIRDEDEMISVCCDGSEWDKGSKMRI